jgi:hypothetical protein
MVKLKDGKITEESHVTKKCPSCYTYVPLDAIVCPSCKAKIGRVDKHGMATKRVEWGSYVICILAWITFGVYAWFAFFK